MSYQSITIVGRLGRDPEMSYTTSGQANTKFSVATDRGYTGSDGQPVKETSWFRVTVWGKQAESCNQYLKKGRMVLVEGRLSCDSKTGGPRIWTRQDGTANASFEITANTVRFLSSKSEREDSPEPAAAEDAGDVPF